MQRRNWIKKLISGTAAFSVVGFVDITPVEGEPTFTEEELIDLERTEALSNKGGSVSEEPGTSVVIRFGSGRGVKYRAYTVATEEAKTNPDAAEELANHLVKAVMSEIRADYEHIGRAPETVDECL